MADHWVFILPRDPWLMPTKERQLAALEYFQQLAKCADEIRLIERPNPGFLHCGAYFQRIECPACRAGIEDGWWTARMTEDSINPIADEGFKLDRHCVPCCGAELTLNDIVYDAPQGFARFAIEAQNPYSASSPYDGPRTTFSDENVAMFEQILDAPVRVIYGRI